MKNTYKKRSNTGLNSFGTKKEFKNVPIDKKFNPIKNWYGTIQTPSGSLLVTYEGKFRSGAKAIFEEEARLSGGSLDSFIGTF